MIYNYFSGTLGALLETDEELAMHFYDLQPDLEAFEASLGVGDSLYFARLPCPNFSAYNQPYKTFKLWQFFMSILSEVREAKAKAISK